MIIYGNGGKNMISKVQLQQLKESYLNKNKREHLVDIKNITVNNSPDKIQRIINYIETVKNPYMFRVGDTAVEIRFRKNNVTLQELFTNIALRK